MAIATTASTSITYTKLRNGSWGLRGAGLVAGARVTVTKRDGSAKTETVGRILWTGDGVSLATIAHSAHRHSGSRRYAGARWEDRYCRACGHTGDDCADMDCTCRTCGGMMR